MLSAELLLSKLVSCYCRLLRVRVPLQQELFPEHRAGGPEERGKLDGQHQAARPLGATELLRQAVRPMGASQVLPQDTPPVPELKNAPLVVLSHGVAPQQASCCWSPQQAHLAVACRHGRQPLLLLPALQPPSVPGACLVLLCWTLCSHLLKLNPHVQGFIVMALEHTDGSGSTAKMAGKRAPLFFSGWMSDEERPRQIRQAGWRQQQQLVVHVQHLLTPAAAAARHRMAECCTALRLAAAMSGGEGLSGLTVGGPDGASCFKGRVRCTVHLHRSGCLLLSTLPQLPALTG